MSGSREIRLSPPPPHHGALVWPWRFAASHHSPIVIPKAVDEVATGEAAMLRTSLCDLLGIDVPIILAGMGGVATSAEFAAAASNEGGLGSIGSLFRPTAAIKRDIDVVKELTNRNFAVNH